MPPEFTIRFFGSELHCASVYGNLDRVKELIKDYDVNLINQSNITPLHYATIEGHLDIVKFLLNNGANANATYEGETRPLHIASLNGHYEILKILVKLTEVDVKRDDGTTSLILGLFPI